MSRKKKLLLFLLMFGPVAVLIYIYRVPIIAGSIFGASQFKVFTHGRPANLFGCDYLNYPENIILSRTKSLDDIAARSMDSQVTTQRLSLEGDIEQLNLTFHDGDMRHELVIRTTPGTAAMKILYYHVYGACNVHTKRVKEATKVVFDSMLIDSSWVDDADLTEVSSNFFEIY